MDEDFGDLICEVVIWLEYTRGIGWFRFIYLLPPEDFYEDRRTRCARFFFFLL
jgi:hypothetical protein